MEKIKMTTPLVEMDGDEMTRIIWKMIIADAIFKFLLSYLFSKRSGIVFDPKRAVIFFVRRARTRQATRPPKMAFATPIQTAARPKDEPNLPA